MDRLKKFLKKNWLLFFCFLVIVLQFTQIVYFKRASFFQPYNAFYWKDRFEHSQYTLPLSLREIGDDGLYSYAGYRLVHGASIESTISDKPPVGLYLAGLSIFLAKNPLWGEWLVGISMVICFFLLILELLKDKEIAFMATALFTLEPFIFSMFSITLLDLPQLFFLLLHLLLLLYAIRFKKFRVLLTLFSGVSLGLFTETKPALLLPIIVFLEGLYLLKNKYFFSFAPLFVGFVMGIISPYFRFFQMGYNLVDYLKLHKYMASIYLSAHNRLFPLSIWQSLFIGYFPDVVTGKLNKIDYWWPVLPFITAFGVLQALKTLIQRKYLFFLKGLAIFFLMVLVVYTFVPSYARYLVLIIPFLYIFAAQFFKKYISKPVFLGIFVVITITGFFYSSYLLFPSADNVLQGFKYNFSHQYFQDIYQEDLSVQSRLPYSQQQFRKITQQALIDASVVDVNFKELSRFIPYIGNAGQVKYLVTYTTRDLGKFSEEKTVSLINEQGQWKVNWNWNLLLNYFKPYDKFTLSIAPGKRGTIYDSKGNVLVSDENSFLIKINPDKINTKREQEMLKLLHNISLQKMVHLQNAYLENPLPDSYIPVATLFINLNNKEQAELNTYPGLKLDIYTSRLYSATFNPLQITDTVYDECCTRIYSSSNYHGVSGIEKQYDKLLSGYNGGALILTDKNGNPIKTLITRQPKNGKDISLP